MPRFSKILCPVDFDANSLRALRTASEMARERKATLYLLHVVALPPGPEVALPFGQIERQARARLERLARPSLRGKVRYEIEVMMGDPAVETLRIANRLGANLIIVATHGRRGLRRLVLGSVAERIIREAPCPVLAVRAKPARSAKSSTRPRMKVPK
jgi:nucleotide-binding universal stress UspA family protein